MAPAREIPSLMDDDEFLNELEKLEGEPPRSAADRASRVALASGFSGAQQSSSPPTPPVLEGRRIEPDAAAGLAIPRDIDRWNIHGFTTEALEHIAPSPASKVPAFFAIVIGLCVGAAGSALLLHDRVARIVDLFSRR
jgi:hypothetical protein